MSTLRGSMMELDGRFLGVEGNFISFLVMPGARLTRVPLLDVGSDDWKTATVGQDIVLKVSTDFCVRSGLFEGTMSSRPSGSVGPIVG